MIVASLIRVIHCLFVAFMVVTPFIGNEIFLTYHFITVPFLILHWITNNDTCALTLLESTLTGVEENHTFIGNIIKPIYNAHLDSKHYYWISVLLFLITTYRLHYQYSFWYVLLVYRVFVALIKKGFLLVKSALIF